MSIFSERSSFYLVIPVKQFHKNTTADNTRTTLFALCCRPSVCLSSVTFVLPTQAVEIFGNVLACLTGVSGLVVNIGQ